LSYIAGHFDHADLWTGLLDPGRAAVSGCIVDHDDLEVDCRIAAVQALEAGKHLIGSSEIDDHDAERRRGCLLRVGSVAGDFAAGRLGKVGDGFIGVIVMPDESCAGEGAMGTGVPEGTVEPCSAAIRRGVARDALDDSATEPLLHRCACGDD
jgi:hypothetical protein